jgi:hypothetical protein
MSTLEQSLSAALSIEGATGVALVDYQSGMLLAKEGGAGVNLDLAASGNSDVVRAKLKTMKSLNITGDIEDILITLDEQYHLIRILKGQNLFLYLMLTRSNANLAMARHKLSVIEKNIKV